MHLRVNQNDTTTSGLIKGNKLVKVTWATCCQGIKDDGLGLRDLRKLNFSLISLLGGL